MPASAAMGAVDPHGLSAGNHVTPAQLRQAELAHEELVLNASKVQGMFAYLVRRAKGPGMACCHRALLWSASARACLQLPLLCVATSPPGLYRGRPPRRCSPARCRLSPHRISAILASLIDALGAR